MQMDELKGEISDRLWPLVPLRSGAGSLWALVDTGFEGYLMTSAAEATRHGATRTSRFASSINADGSESVVPMGRLRLEWLGRQITVEAHLSANFALDGTTHAGTPVTAIIGLYLLQGLRLTFDLYPGRAVTIGSLS
jgi:predicted aspartyl protease